MRPPFHVYTFVGLGLDSWNEVDRSQREYSKKGMQKGGRRSFFKKEKKLKRSEYQMSAGRRLHK
jgi:hypothetical protein